MCVSVLAWLWAGHLKEGISGLDHKPLLSLPEQLLSHALTYRPHEAFEKLLLRDLGIRQSEGRRKERWYGGRGNGRGATGREGRREKEGERRQQRDGAGREGGIQERVPCGANSAMGPR